MTPIAMRGADSARKLSIVLTALLVSAASVSFATVSDTIPAGWESYLERPDVVSLQGRSEGLEWESLKASHFSFVAELLVLYPTEQLYFLARDAEYIYDSAKLATQGTADFDRIHLLNVSTPSVLDPHLKDYLRDNGISEQSLLAERRVVFVDTGFAGTIPKAIGDQFSADARTGLKTHMGGSRSLQHPSSRVFLRAFTPLVNTLDPATLHGRIGSYEHMQHFTDRATRYLFFNGRWHPISPVGTTQDGRVSREGALRHMHDLNHYWSDQRVQEEFQSQRSLFLELKSLVMSPQRTRAARRLQQLLRDDSTKLVTESFIRDLYESRPNTGLRPRITLSDLNLKPVLTTRPSIAKKHELMLTRPEWIAYLENPTTNIPELFHRRNWRLIHELLAADVDAEINRVLTAHLYDRPATGAQRRLQVSTIRNANQRMLQLLVQHTFSQPHTASMTELLRLLVDRADAATLRLLPEYVFSKPHSARMTDLMQLVIERGDAFTLRLFASETFSRPHTARMQNLLRDLIERGDQDVLRLLARYTFSQPHTESMTDLLRLLVQRGDTATVRVAQNYALGQRHTQAPANNNLREGLNRATTRQAPNSPRQVGSSGRCQALFSKSSIGQLAR